MKRTSESILTDVIRDSTLSDKSREKLVEEADDRVFAADCGSTDVIDVVVVDENQVLSLEQERKRQKIKREIV